jgi:thioredoxin-dependent peroxiredoxin
MLPVGQEAPDFDLQSDQGLSVSLKSLRGKFVVLYFYPKDDTPGCTIEANEFSSHMSDFTKKNTVVLGISKDSVKSHNDFVCKYNLGITLLSDPDASVTTTYGAWQKKGAGMGTVRSTYLIDPRGTIAVVWENVNANGHAAEVLARL